MSKAAEVIDRIHTISDIGTWRSIVELNFGTNQIQKLPDDIALLENLEARNIKYSNTIRTTDAPLMIGI